MTRPQEVPLILGLFSTTFQGRIVFCRPHIQQPVSDPHSTHTALCSECKGVLVEVVVVVVVSLQFARPIRDESSLPIWSVCPFMVFRCTKKGNFRLGMDDQRCEKGPLEVRPMWAQGWRAERGTQRMTPYFVGRNRTKWGDFPTAETDRFFFLHADHVDTEKKQEHTHRKREELTERERRDDVPMGD